jgi:phage I-like protein
VNVHFTYYADLGGVLLDESGKGWIQAMRVGEYQHPKYGKLSFTLDRLRRFAESVTRQVRGIDPDIDYDHKMDPTKGNEAAGWVKGAKVEGDALWLLVEWTKTAAEKIRDRAYRYFSPEFQTEWTDPQGRKHQDVLFGGGITNRPFLKDLLPLNLSELSFAEPDKEMTLDPKKLRKALGLPEDATDEQVMERVEQNQAAATNKVGTPPDRTATTHAPNNPATDTPSVPGGPGEDKDANKDVPPGAPHPASFPQQHQASLSELMTNPAIKMLVENLVNPLQTRLAELEKTNLLNGVEVRLSEYRTGDKVLAPAVVDEFRKLLSETPASGHAAVYAIMDKLRSGSATVQLGETAGTGRTSKTFSEGKTAEQVVEERVKVLLSENKDMTRADAYELVFGEDLALFAAYQDASYSFKI